MAFNKWRFIYSGVGAEHPAIHRAVIEHDDLRTRVVAMLEESLKLIGSMGPVARNLFGK